MKPYKVLVVDDSAFMRKIISDLIENDADFQVTATAKTVVRLSKKSMSFVQIWLLWM